MNWQIPAKTFLVGEYVALQGDAAIILTTTPCFSLTRKKNTQPCFHPDSPAGKFWLNSKHSLDDLVWQDPYDGLGGLGASSAQFIGAYWAANELSKKNDDLQTLLTTYYQFAWKGEGIRPSGYDVIGQTQDKCVYINQNKQVIESLDWSFKDISFVLLRTGNKLATHQHLQKNLLFPDFSLLSEIVEEAKAAFNTANDVLLVKTINQYQQQLMDLNLTTEATLEKIKILKKNANLLAIKGCGALGADILLLIFPRHLISTQIKKLNEEGWIILADETNLYKKSDRKA